MNERLGVMLTRKLTLVVFHLEWRLSDNLEGPDHLGMTGIAQEQSLTEKCNEHFRNKLPYEGTHC